jgi:hypothetical protein
MRHWGRIFCFTALVVPGAILPAQRSSSTAAKPTVAVASAETTPTPTQPVPARIFHDPTYKITIDFPGNWTFSRKDGEISTFHLDARSAPHNTRLRAVAAMPENPFPASTFSGAYVYLSVIPRSNSAACDRQTVQPGVTPPIGYVRSQIAGVSFTHGHDEQKHICTTDRDEIYTTLHRGACYRFDLTINNFCGGEVSGVKDISAQELEQVRKRLEGVLATIRFDP